MKLFEIQITPPPATPPIQRGVFLAGVGFAPSEEGPDYLVSGSQVTSLEGLPEVVNELRITDCPNLTSLVGIPKRINSNLVISNSPKLSLSGIHKLVEFIMDNAYIMNINGPMLGFMLIKGLQFIQTRPDKELGMLITRNIKKGDLHTCQEEMLDNGYIEQAQL